MELTEKLKLADILVADNVARLLPDDDCAKIAYQVHDNWTLDAISRQPWDDRMEGAFKLALQVVEEKSFPWTGCANVKLPLITIAALQFHARAYPALVSGPEIVKCRVFGEDLDGRKSARAQRVAEHMSYQVLEEDEGWEDSMDRVLITVPIVGCAFKKSYFDTVLGHNVSENVLARDIYIPYFAKSLEKASRVTQVLYLQSNEMREMELKGLYLDGVCDQAPQYEGPTPGELARDQAQGIQPAPNDPEIPFEVLEQHCWFDLDGDGYQEPYVVSVRRDTRQLCRIVARFQSRDIKHGPKGIVQSIKATQYFTKYPFIPSPDGSIYDLGWGVLLGPLNESINTTINQILDAGTLATTGGGFLGRGAKFRSGDNSFKPFEWKRVDATGDDLRKSIVPLSTKEPSAVLFQLLNLLIEYGERVAGATDPQVGVNPGQNTPAETSRNTIAEGQRVFQGIFKRLYRAMKSEFRKLYALNQIYLDDIVSYYSTASDSALTVLKSDYAAADKSICPAADPNMVSGAERLIQARFLKEASMTTPGYDKVAVEHRFLESLRITNVEEVFPGPDKVPATPDAKLEIEKAKIEQKNFEVQSKTRIAALELLGQAELNQAKINELNASATKLMAEAQGIDVGHKLAIINTQIGATKQHQDSLLRAAKLLQDTIFNQQKGTTNGNSNGAGMAGMAAASSDPGLLGVSGGAAGTEQGAMGNG